MIAFCMFLREWNGIDDEIKCDHQSFYGLFSPQSLRTLQIEAFFHRISNEGMLAKNLKMGTINLEIVENIW